MANVERQADRDFDVLSAARHRRMGVQAAMADVESALASASSGRGEAWAGQVAAAVARLQQAFRHHIEVTESDDGLFADVVEQAPRLAHQVEVLRAEHDTIEAGLASAAERATARGGPGGPGGDTSGLTDEVLDVLGRIVRHRHAGASLVYEAYNVDIEAGD